MTSSPSPSPWEAIPLKEADLKEAFPLPEGLTKNDKWKMASHMQKAVRHGRPEDAAQACAWLLHVDEPYARYRAAVMAMEDVAGAEPQRMAQVLASGWGAMRFYNEGGPGALVRHVYQWATWTKDRTPCEWQSCAYWRQEFEEKFGKWEMLTFGKAGRLAFDLEQPWWVRGLAAWRLAGNDKMVSSALPKIGGDWERYMLLAAHAGLDEASIACVEAGAKIQGEVHPIFLPLALHAQRHEGTQIQHKPFPVLGYAGPWYSAALDKHTAEGKTALAHCLKMLPEATRQFAQEGVNQATLQEALGKLWFWMEGGAVNEGLHYATSHTIDQDIKRRKMAYDGVNAHRLFERFGTQTKTWHEARITSLGQQAQVQVPMSLFIRESASNTMKSLRLP